MRRDFSFIFWMLFLSFSFTYILPSSRSFYSSLSFLRTHFRFFFFFLLLYISVVFFIISLLYFYIRTRSPRLIRFLFIVALAAVAHDVSFERDLSLYRKDRPRQGRAFQHRRKARLPPSEFRTVLIWEPSSILSRRHVKIFQIPIADT